jgi:hypothetical protein
VKFEAPKLTEVEIRSLADEKRLEFLGDDCPLNFNVERLIEQLGLTILPVSGLKADFGLEAMPIFCDDKILIDEDSYDDTFSWYGRLRFTLMHELAHFVLHKELLMQVQLRDVQQWSEYVLAVEKECRVLESQANEFAGRFLVPPDRLKLMIPVERQAVVASNKTITNSQLQKFVYSRLGRKFNVTPTVISIRISKEGLQSLLP